MRLLKGLFLLLQNLIQAFVKDRTESETCAQLPTLMEDRLQSPACLKMEIMAIIVLLTQVPLAASERDMTLTYNNSGHTYYVWDDTMKTVENCSRFHWAETPSYFFDWPEDLPLFHYCCTSYTETNLPLNQHNLGDYVYSKHGQEFELAWYYDVQVTVDPCLPYWKCWKSEALKFNIKYATFKIRCEANDLRRFYTVRLWKSAIGKSGILMSALPLIGLLEFVFLLTTLALGSSRLVTSPWKKIFKCWWGGLPLAKLRSWLHLVLLAVEGNCFMEAIVLTPVYSWESRMMNNCAFIYLLLLIAEWFASFVQQVTNWRLVDVCILQKLECEVIKEKLRFEFNSDDWRWQPIFLQIATLSLLVLYITYGTSESRTEFVSLLLGVASVAMTWSFLVAIILLFRKSSLLVDSFKSSFVVSERYRILKDISNGSRNVYQLNSEV